MTQYNDCLKKMDNCFGCGKSGHKVKYCSIVTGQDKESGKASGSNDASEKNHFYALRSRGEHEIFPRCGYRYVNSFQLMYIINLIRALHNLLLLH